MSVYDEYESSVTYSSSRRHGRPPVHITGKVTDCKDELRRRFGASEPTAHRLLQRVSMDLKIPLDKAADALRLGFMALDHLKDDEAYQYKRADDADD